MPGDARTRTLATRSVDVNDSAPDGDVHGLGAIANFEFREDVLHVNTGSLRADCQCDGDLLVTAPRGDELHERRLPAMSASGGLPAPRASLGRPRAGAGRPHALRIRSAAGRLPACPSTDMCSRPHRAPDECPR